MVVAIGYQLYDTARSAYRMSIPEAAFQLGLLGLAQFLPLMLLTPVAGVVADRFDRRWVGGLAIGIDALVALILAISTRRGTLSLPLLFTLAAMHGAARSSSAPPSARSRPTSFPPSSCRERSPWDRSPGRRAEWRAPRWAVSCSGWTGADLLDRGRVAGNRLPRAGAHPPHSAATWQSRHSSCPPDRRRLPLCLERALPAGLRHARPLRRAARRRDCADAGVRPRHPPRRPRGTWPDARCARARRRGGCAVDVLEAAGKECRGQDALGRRSLRRGNAGLRPIALVPALVAVPRGAGRGRYGFGLRAQQPGAIEHARPSARPASRPSPASPSPPRTNSAKCSPASPRRCSAQRERLSSAGSVR